MSVKKKLIRYYLFNSHRELVKGSPEDMLVAHRLLGFLRKGEIRLGFGDVDWRTEQELEKAGVHISYSRRGYVAYARIDWKRKEMVE